MITIQNAENALKSVYLGAITELLNTKANPLLTKIEQTGADVWGKEIRKAVSFGISGGIGAGDEDGELPSSGAKKYLQMITTLKNLFGQIEISDKAIRASADGRGAFTDLLNAELQSLLDSSKFNLGRMLYGTSSGVLCTVGAKSGASYPVSKTNALIEGMIVDVYGSSGTLSASGVRLASVDRAQNTITFESEPASAVTASSKMYVQGSKGKEITGLGDVFAATGSIYGLSRSAYPFLAPYTKSDVGPIDDIVIQRAIDSLENNANSEVDFIACAADVKYAYQDYLSQFKRNVDIMELEGGYKTLSFNGIPLVYERFVDNGVMYLLNTKSMKLHQLCDWRFLETENGKILRQNQGRATYAATLVKYCDLICDRPNGLGRLSGITAE
ncbi:MAG: phage major capsid protein [Clostridiales bacterium]|jgi:hypothetical protein|nr:phage major capsid protein [Clostridiales bacterium]